MKLNFDILFDSLSEIYSLRRYGTARKELHIAAPRFYTERWSADYIYVLENQTLPEGFSVPVVCTASGGADFSRASGPVMVVQDCCSVQELMNALLKIMEEFDVWDHSMQDAVAQRRDLSELAGIGARKIGCRLLINDKNLVLLADSRYYNACEGERFDYQGQFLPDEIIRTINQDYSLGKLQKQGYFTGQDGRYGGSLVYCKNLCIGERYEGTCSVMEDGRSFRESDLALFQHFFQYADELFVFYHGTRGKHSRALRMVMEDLLQEKQISGQLQLEAESYRRDFEDYRCLVLQSAGRQMLPYDYLCLALESSFDGCISLLFEGLVVGFLPRFELSQADGLQQRFGQLDLMAGISACGHGIMDCRNLYCQAAGALAVGRETDIRKCWYFFEELRLPWLLRNSVGPLPFESLQTEGMKRLRDYDAASQVDYLNTLKVYLDQEMNIAETAKALYLHRSSLLKRLKRLQELLGDELLSPEGRLLLRWQLYFSASK
ncbi:MAG TPA: helix-turn-helix domain-containing protein [Candidatus Eisenbergiella merdavium]|uniref:Helix-turn-helix domain-containing protein n=1 Tax=Candidatus Eisenbergiella merdavium TaxID=2838551 RepID=A0A9D2NL35_9FIRM|nr:helix-turn-helix domain-containing protein [Candidatus Eisenbergiella merdavium]